MSQSRNPSLGRLIHHIAEKGDEEQERTAHDLVDAIGNSNDVLVRAETVFPFTLFPTTVAVDRTKISITERDFFKAGEVLSIRIEDLLNITTHVGPFLGSIKISTRFFNPEKPYVVDKLKRADALKIKRIVQGYLIARQENIDCSSLPTKELSIMLDEMGKVSPEDRL
jgi:hypothetical protein